MKEAVGGWGGVILDQEDEDEVGVIKGGTISPVDVISMFPFLFF